MTKWEYKDIALSNVDTEKTLNRYGKDGWELVSTYKTKASGFFRGILKRPVNEDQ